MSDELLQAVLRYTRVHSRADGVAPTPVRGLYLIARTAPSELEHAVVRPLVCLVLQGCKQVRMASGMTAFGAADTMIVTGNVPTVSRISEASAAKPYLSLALDLDPAVLTDLIVGAGAPPATPQDTSDDLRDAMRRLVRLLERPASLAALGSAVVREVHHWLLLGQQGPAIRHLGIPDSQAQRIGRAVAMLRSDYARPLPIGRLAAAAGMSRSTFHEHFRAVTSLTPLQFQKHLRLIEARRLILSKGQAPGKVAFAVGYESASQFSREYARMHGQPPARDKQAAAGRWAAPGSGEAPAPD